MSGASDGREKREADELRDHVAQLKAELERAKAEVKEIHRDKVKEVKSTRDAEQAQSREQLDGLRSKLQREKAEELQELREQLNGEFQGKVKALEIEKQKLKENLITELHDELEKKISAKYEADRRKMQYAMFEIEQQRSGLEAKNADLSEAGRNTTAVLRDVDKQHKSEIENLNKQHRLALKKQMEELEAMKRALHKKDKELASMTAVQSRIEADKDKLQDEIKRLKQAESWTRRSTTPPSLSPSSSMNDLVSKRERDMVMKNSELSFRVRTLEETISQLRKDKSKLQSLLSESRRQVAPLEEHKVKLNHRINELNTTLRSSEKRIEKMSKNILELKSSKQQLEEDNARQKKTLQQQMSQNSTHRVEKEKLRSRNMSLSGKLENLKSENKDLQDRLSTSWPMSGHTSLSPLPLSPTSSIDGDSTLSSSAGSGLFEEWEQLRFDKDESQAKYEEMKGEYLSIRDKYKTLRSKYEELQGKYKQQQVKDRQLELLKKEHMELEREVALLRKAGKISPSHDVRRFESNLDSLYMELDEKEKKICELEDFIVEQDEVASKSEEKLKREKSELQAQLEELSKTKEDIVSVHIQQLNVRVSELESELEKAHRLLQAKETEIEQLEHKALESQLHTDSEEGESATARSPLSSAQLEQCVSRYKIQIMELEKKNSNLQDNFDDAIAQVSQLQGLTFELEGRLQEDERAHQEVVAGRDDEIELLNDRLTQLETKLVKLKRALPIDEQEQVMVDGPGKSDGRLRADVSQEELEQLTDEVFEATKRVKLSTASESLRAEISSLEEAISRLICSFLPDYAPVLPSSNPPETTKREEDEQPSSTSESTPSSSLLEISSDFTALPLTYEKVLSPSRDSPSWTAQHHSPLNSHIPFDEQSEQAAGLEQVDYSLPSTQGTTDSDFYQALFRQHEKPLLVDASAQTSDPVRANSYTQTPTGAKKRNFSSQTSALRLTNTSSQTVADSQPVGRDKSSQTRAVRTPRMLDQSSQTQRVHKPIVVNRSSQTHGSARGRVSDKACQTWSSRQMPKNILFPTHPSIKDWVAEERMPLHSSPVNTAPQSPPRVRDKHPPTSSEGGEQLPRVFVAVMDYDPKSLCTTGRPEYELSLHTGDVVSVEGEMDEDGYYHASFGGVSGLVPANFVQESEVTDFSTRERLFNQSLTHNLSTASYSSSPTVQSQHQYSPTTQPRCYLPKDVDCLSPQSPLSLHVERAGKNSLLVAWQPPPMDSMCRSNGCLVTGYQLYVNRETNMLVSGATQSKAVVSGVPLTKIMQLGISTSSVEGKSSKVMEIVYNGRPVSISSTSPEPEVFRTYTALYDYNPMKHSPNDNPEFELAFKQGDIISVHGREKDGYLVGELNGKQGWVPATFLSQVSGPVDKDALSPSGNSSGQHFSSRKMMAAYDYDPKKMSPNANSDVELTFKTGDIITIYGNMQGDGFYSGELNGKVGLVPSNFLQDL